MAEGTSGPGPEGAAPLNPQARADIDQSLADAGVKGELNPKATEDVDRALQTAGVNDLKSQSEKNVSPISEKAGQNPWDNLPHKVMYVKDEPPINQSLSSDANAEPQIYTPESEKPTEFSDTRSAVGVSVKRFRAEGPRILRPEDKTLGGTRTEYTGVVVDTPEGRKITIIKGGLSGATFIREYDSQGREVASSELHGSLGVLIAKAAETYPPSELPHLIDATIRLQKSEREQLKQKIGTAGGRNKYLMQEAQRLVQEGRYSSIEIARGIVLIQTEVYPSYPQTEAAIEKAVNSNELPEDITDPEEATKIMQDLDFCARYPGMTEDLARKIPGLMRIATMTPDEKARFAYKLAQILTETILGENNTSKIPFENSQQLSQIELNAGGLGNRATGIIDILNYTWGKVIMLQQKAGMPTGRPNFRI